MGTELPSGYKPSESEPFMNERQREYFRNKLTAWKDDILRESRETIHNLQSETVPNADLADRAATEAERQLELRTRDRQRKLISKIDAALRRLEDRFLWLLRRDGRTHLAETPRRAPHRDAFHRSAGTARAARKSLSRRLSEWRVANSEWISIRYSLLTIRHLRTASAHHTLASRNAAAACR